MRRFVSGLALCYLCYFVLVFFSPFSIVITSLREERANLSAFRTFVVPRLFEEKRGDIVFGFPWCVVRGSEFIVGTL